MKNPPSVSLLTLALTPTPSLVSQSSPSQNHVAMASAAQQTHRAGHVVVHCATWNVGNKQPTRASMDAWLASARTADVVAVAAQEAHFTTRDSSASASSSSSSSSQTGKRRVSFTESIGATLGKTGGRLLGAIGGGLAGGLMAGPAAPVGALMGAAAGFYSGGEVAGEEESRVAWFNAVHASLGGGQEFDELCRETLLQMRLQVFVRRRSAAGLVQGKCESSYAATGLLGVVGNKGGIAARVMIHNTSIMFVACHLAAHEGAEYRAHRLSNLREILSTATALGPLAVELGGDGHLCSSYTFLMGDLNFRLHESTLNAALDEAGMKDASGTAWDRTSAIAIRGTASQRAALFRAGDELLQCMATGSCLQGFAEAPAAFAPTFKLLKDGSGYNPKRLPAWTDRVLCHSLPGVRQNLKVRRYSSVLVPDITSDHMPVVCSFEVPLAGSSASGERPSRVVVRLRDCSATFRLTSEIMSSMGGSTGGGYFAWLVYAVDMNVPHPEALLGVWPCAASRKLPQTTQTWDGEMPGMGLPICGGVPACESKHLLLSLCWYASWPPHGKGGTVAPARRAAAAASTTASMITSATRTLGGTSATCFRLCSSMLSLRSAYEDRGEWANFTSTLSQSGEVHGTCSGKVSLSDRT